MIAKIYPHGVVGDEYFLIENRQRTGFDATLPTPGLAIWHIDNSQPNNNTSAHKRVDLEEADGFDDLDWRHNRGDAGDLFPGANNNRLFDDTTRPSALGYDGNETCLKVSNIAN